MLLSGMILLFADQHLRLDLLVQPGALVPELVAEVSKDVLMDGSAFELLVVVLTLPFSVDLGHQREQLEDKVGVGGHVSGLVAVGDHVVEEAALELLLVQRLELQVKPLSYVRAWHFSSVLVLLMIMFELLPP